MRRRILSLAMSVVLAFSMVSATALTAFADSLEIASMPAQAASGKIVYDDVYGVFGGEYALMYKDVQYQGTGTTITQTVADVVKADGSVTVHTAPSMPPSVEVPGGRASYQLEKENWIKYGFIGLKANDQSSKHGVKRLDGTDLVPCSFDGVSYGDDTFAAVTSGTADVKISFFGLDGEACGTLSADCSPVSQGSGNTYMSMQQYGQYIRVSGRADAGYYDFCAKKTDSTYELMPDIKRVYDGRHGEGLYLRADGNTCFSSSNGTEILLSEGEGRAWQSGYIYSNGIRLVGYPASSDADAQEACYSKAGTAMSRSDLIAYPDDTRFNNATDSMLADGTVVDSITGLDSAGNEIVRNGYTLARDTTSAKKGSRNSSKHGNSDTWWAKDSAGKWGAIDSSGNVKVPFLFEGYFDSGAADTDYALVKQDGQWHFVNVSTGKLTDVASKDISTATISGLSAQTYNGTPLEPVPNISLDGTPLSNGTDYTLAYTNNVNAGTATVTATGVGDYEGQASATFTINKAANPMKVKAKVTTKKLKAKTLAKKAKSFAAVKFTKKAVGKVTYKSASSKKVAKKFKVNKKTGKVTAKKGTKAGTYKVKVKVKAAGDANRKSASKTITVKVKVK